MSDAPTPSQTLADQIKGLNQARNVAGKPFRSLCYAPFVQLSFNTDGTAAVCCMSRHQPIGNVMNEGLLDMWRGSRMQAFRKALAHDVFPLGCEQCKWELEMGNVGNNPLRMFDKMPVDPKGEWPTRLEFAMSNLCNLGCVHCFGELSTVIRTQEGRPPMPRAYGDRFFTDLRQFLPHARQTSFVGGEPFLQPECFRVWDMLIEMQLTPEVFVTTNGTVFNDRVRRVLDSLPAEVAVSLDSMNPRTFEKVRVNARYGAVLRNVQLFREQRLAKFGRAPLPHEYLLTLNFVLMTRNWRDLADGFLFAEENQCAIWVTPLVSPKHLSVFELPPRTLQAMARVLDQQTTAIAPKLVRNRVKWMELVKMVHKAAEDAERRRPGVAPGAAARSTENPMGEAWAAMQRGDEAAAFAAAARTQPTDQLYTVSLVFRGELLMRHGKLAESDALLTEAGTLGDKSADLFLRRGWLRLRQDRLPECEQEVARLEKAIQANPKAPGHVRDGLLELRANLADRRGDVHTVLVCVEELHHRHPEREDVRAHLERLRLTRAV